MAAPTWVRARGRTAMGIFGSGRTRSAQDDVDLREVKDRLVRLETDLRALQTQVATLAAGGAADGAVPYSDDGSDGSPLGPPSDAEWLAEVRRLKDSGKTIHAIKTYREHTGVGLKEAKDAVERM